MSINLLSLKKLRATSRVGLLSLASVFCSNVFIAQAMAVELIGKPVPLVQSTNAQVASVGSSLTSSTSSIAAATTTATLSNVDAANESNEGNASSTDQMDENSDKNFQEAMKVIGPKLDNALNNHPEIFDDIGAALLIPLFGIVFCVGGPLVLIMFLVWMHYRAKDKRIKNINANIERLLAAGRDIPIELLRGDEPYGENEMSVVRDDVSLQKAIKNMCVGVGVLVCLTIIFGVKLGAIGFIWISIGLSQLLVWRLSSVKKDSGKIQG